jgi:hypothetical protein
MAVYSENIKNLVNSLRRQSAEIWIVKIGGTYSYHYALKGY